MHSARRLAASIVLSATTAALVAVPVAGAGADTPPPAGYTAGTGNFAGTESVLQEQFVFGTGCALENTRTVFALRGAGTYEGVTTTGQPVVYKTAITSSQTLYGDGPLHVEAESTETYYHGPAGSYGTDSACNAASLGAPTTAEFRIWATDHVYRLDGGGAQVPCVGHGTFGRSDGGNDWHAQWTLDSDCTVVGNAAGMPGTGLARAGTGFTHQGTHGPCFDTCTENLEFDYVQYLPYIGLHLGLTGPVSTKINTPATMTASLTDDGLPVASASVSFSVSGPGSTSPSSGSRTTGADGRANFGFTTATVGNYTVTATTPSDTPGETLTAIRTVQFIPPPPPTVVLSGPTAAQTEENVRVAAAFTNNDLPVSNVQVHFSVTGPATAVPATRTTTTDSNGWALFDFIGGKAGDYTVTATATFQTKQATDSFTVPLEINTFSRQGALTLPAGEHDLEGAVIDPAGDYAYFGNSAGVVKVDLETFQRVGLLDLPDGESGMGPAIIDPAGNYAYFGNDTSFAGSASTPCGSCITKVDLHTFQRVGVVNLPGPRLRSGVIDPVGRFGYFSFNLQSSDPGKVAKVDLETLQVVGTLTFPTDETAVNSAAMSPTGDFAYFAARGEGSLPARLVKVDLAAFQRVGSLPMADRFENNASTTLIDPAGRYAYLGLTQAAGGSSDVPDHVVKVDLATFARVDSITLESWSAYFLAVETRLTGVMDPAGNFAYFGTQDAAGREQRVIRVDLRTFEKDTPVTVTDAGQGFVTGAITPDSSHAYFGTSGQSCSVCEIHAPKIVKLALNRPPKAALAAADDAYATNYATPLSVSAPGVLANDVDTEDGDPLLAGQASDPAGGSVSLDANGSFTYTPDVGFSGTDTFTYTADDRRDYSAPATVSVAVGAPPAGVSSVAGGACGYYTNVGLFGGAPELRGCGQTLNDAVGTSPSVTLAPAGSTPVTATKVDGAMALYGPAAIFSGIFPEDGSAPARSGPLSATTQGTTGPGGSSTSSADVVLHDTPVPVRCDGDPVGTTDCASLGGIGPGPVIAEEAHSTCTANQSGLSGSATITNGILETKYDAATQLATVSEDVPASPPANYTRTGTLDHVGDSFRVVYNEQILSADSITVNAVHMYLLGPTAVGDMVVGQSRCSITTNAPDAAPVAADDAYTAGAGHRLVVGGPGVLGNDTDADFGPLRASPEQAVAPPTAGGGEWTFPSDPAHGTLALRTDGSFTYTPEPGYTGPDSFTYLAQDSRGRSDVATVSLEVVEVPNAAPTAGDDAYTTNEDTTLTVAAPGVVGNDTDADNDTVNAGSASTPAHGTLSLDADGSFTYTPTANYHGPDSFTYTASDGLGGSDTATVALTVSSVNDVPTAGDDTASTAFNTAVTVAAPGVLANDTDADGDTMVAGSATTAAHGTVSLGANGSFVYTPASGFSGTDTFTYTASDGNGGADTATVTVTVAAAPPPAISIGSVTVPEGDAGTRPAIFTVSLSAPAASTVTVNFATANVTATAGSDYTAKSGSVSFAAGVTTAKVKVPVLGDAAVEANEAFTVVLSGAAGGVIAHATGTGSVVNDDASTSRRLAIGDVSVHEGDAGIRKAVFTVSLSKSSTTAVKVNYATANATATKPGDYSVLSGTLTFAAGVTAMTVAVTINPDNLTEANETFTVNLTTPTGAVVSDASGLGTIVDDD